MFRTIYSAKNPKTDYSDDCSREVFGDYKLCQDERGNYYAEKVGEINVQERIESFADSVDMARLLNDYNYTGDVKVFNQVAADLQSVNVYDLPANKKEAYGLIHQAQRVYQNLPQDYADDFRDFNEFLDVFSSPDSVNAYVEKKRPVFEYYADKKARLAKEKKDKEIDKDVKK